MLSAHQISKSFGLDPILEQVSFSLKAGERLGLVGPNGSGKTTLLRIITGGEKPDSGSVQLTPHTLRVGYLPQGLMDGLDESISSFLARMESDLERLSDRLSELAIQITEEPDNRALHSEYDEVLARLSTDGQGAGRASGVLAALGLDIFDPDTPLAHLSGGQKTRLGLAGVLLSNPQVLLLDEPTNHLDFDMLAWLEDWLLAYRGAVLIVSHDRAFLDRTATGILEIDPLTHRLTAYVGNYSDYVETKASERERQMTAFQDQQDEIVRLRAAAAHYRGLTRFHKGGKADPENTDKFSVGFFMNRGKETVQRAKNIEKRVEHLLTDERIDKPGRTWQMKMEFGETQASGRTVLTLDELAVGYGEMVLLRGLNQQLRFGARAVLVGPNGAGKTTLLRTIAGRIPPLSGQARLGSGVKLGYMTQEQESLNPNLNPFTTLQSLTAMSETEARAFLSKFLFKGDDVFVPVGKLSYGERARLLLASLVAQGCNFLLLDEPINHLDIPSRAQFEQALANFEGTVLSVVHDRYFIASFASEMWQVKDGQLLRLERLNDPLTVE